MNYNTKELPLREQIEKAMQDNGMIREQVALETPIGTFHYDAENNPELVKANRRQQATKPNTNVQQLRMPYGSQQQLRMPNGNEREPRFYVHRNKNTENPKTYSVWNGVPTAAVTGFFDGALGGAERFIDDLTGGAYASMVNASNNSYSNRQKRLQNQANNAGIGHLYDIANTVIDTDASIAKYYYATKFGNKLKF